MSLDRTIAPEIKKTESIHFVAPERFSITENVPLFWMKNVPNATSRIDFYFDAGTAKTTPIIPSLTAGLIFSGTELKNATQIHNELDDHGAYFDVGITHESALISFYALNSEMPHILEIFENAMEQATFPQHEIDELINDRLQKYQINLEKVNFLAQRRFQELIFDDSIYGRLTQLSDFESVKREEIVSFFNEFYKKGLFKVVVVGDFEETFIQKVMHLSQKWALQYERTFPNDFKNKSGRNSIEKQDALQTAVRVGKILFNKKHPDYHQFVILNTILGDYFGSRLMKNIREDKGYTYGIGSYVNELKGSGYFVIGAEVGKDVVEDTLTEIQKEITRLQTELIPQEELDLVKNYLLGQTLKSADGPYAMTDLFLSVDTHGLSLDYYNQFLHILEKTTPEDLLKLAQQYLNWNEMTIVTAG